MNGVERIARSAIQATGRAGRIAKLNLSLSEEKRKIEHLYTDLGRLYYEAHRDDPEGFFVQMFQQLDAATGKIETIKAELEAVKNEKSAAPEGSAPTEAPDIEVEIEVTDGEDGTGPEDETPSSDP